MDRKFLLNAMIAAVVIPVVFGFGYWAYWNAVLKYQPVLLTKDALEVQRLLEASDYVSPGLGRTGTNSKAVYFVTIHGCRACATYEAQEFPKLSAAGVDTRVIAIAPEGLDQSRPEDRTTVAELWLNRSWDLYKKWRADPNWNAEGLRPADGDLARTAVVDAGRKFLKDLTPLLTENRATVRYPLVIWRDNDNRLKVCSCDTPESFSYVRHDLGAMDSAQAPPHEIAPALTPQGQPTLEAKPRLGDIGNFFGFGKTPPPSGKETPAKSSASLSSASLASSASASTGSSASAKAASSAASPAAYRTDFGPGE